MKALVTKESFLETYRIKKFGKKTIDKHGFLFPEFIS